MEATKEKREQDRRAAAGAGDSVQLPTETSPYVQYKKDDDLEDYKMSAYGARGHLPVSDLPNGGTGTDAPTIPGTAVRAGAPRFLCRVSSRSVARGETLAAAPTTTPSTATACRR